MYELNLSEAANVSGGTQIGIELIDELDLTLIDMDKLDSIKVLFTLPTDISLEKACALAGYVADQKPYVEMIDKISEIWGLPAFNETKHLMKQNM